MSQTVYSIVMASYLGEYKGAASDRPLKFVRAVNSVLGQTFQDWELVIVSDGCDLTCSLTKDFRDDRIKLLYLDKQPMWSSAVRACGVENSSGKWICYLDADDFLGHDHLEIIDSQVLEDSFYYYDWYHVLNQKMPFSVHPERSLFRVFTAQPRLNMCTTGSIVHSREVQTKWNRDVYCSDGYFITALAKEVTAVKLTRMPQYYLCHVPNQGDV